MLCIGLSGLARSGKGSVVKLTQILLQKGDVEEEVIQVSLASAVKEEAIRDHGWNGKKDEAGRTLLQTIGMKRREEDPLYWIKILAEKIDDMLTAGLNPDIIYVPDVRFLNEAEFIKKMYRGEIWRIERLNEDGSPFTNKLTAEQKSHPSEVEMNEYKEYDVVLKARNMAELFEGVKAQVERLKKEGKI